MKKAFATTSVPAGTASIWTGASPVTAWDRGDLAKWRASLSDERRERDIEGLSRLFNAAAKVPAAREALEWAKEHGIDFIVDRTTVVNGYYTHGTGVVAISGKSLADEYQAVGVLTHELRHAWQDYHGMLTCRSKNFTDYMIRTALVEADASAHGNLARFQYGLIKTIDYFRDKSSPQSREIVLREQARLDDSMNTTWWMAAEFRQWYSGYAVSYGKAGLCSFGRALGIAGLPKFDIMAEYNPYRDKEVPPAAGIDYERPEQLRRLGARFKGRGNYFNDIPRDRFLREFLSPGRASTLFYQTGRRNFKSYPRPPVADEIRLRELLLKRHRAFQAPR